jgi:hypothetical protein
MHDAGLSRGGEQQNNSHPMQSKAGGTVTAGEPSRVLTAESSTLDPRLRQLHDETEVRR